MGNLIEVQVPDIGEFKDVPVIEVLVQDGDTVAKDQALIVLESDKSTMEVPSPGAGIVRGLKVKPGDKLSKGDRICRLEGEAEKAATASAPPVEAKAEPEPEPKKGKPASPDLFSAAPAESKPKGGRVVVTVPDLGDFKNVPVIELLVKDGDRVDKDQALIVLESDKSTMEVPAPAAGVVRGL
ncbi:MAG: biotin/lipoyl-containing protein, partial [Panacagrimonas sp.]